MHRARRRPWRSPGRPRSSACRRRAHATACRHRPSPWSRSRPACSWRTAWCPRADRRRYRPAGRRSCPTFSPMNSIGASSRSPSPITTVPSIGSLLSSRRIASTAAWSAAFSLPWPRSRAADTAARSVTRTISSVRMRSSNSCGGTEIWVDIGELLKPSRRVFRPATNRFAHRPFGPRASSFRSVSPAAGRRSPCRAAPPPARDIPRPRWSHR